jgi:uncharacterized protein YjbJ (UPF0337 family)
MMNKIKLKGGWNILKGRLRQTLARFTGNPHQKMIGQDLELLGQIQKRAGPMDESSERALHEWLTAWHS